MAFKTFVKNSTKFFSNLTLRKMFFVTGLSSPSGDCDPGFYCPGGNDLPNPIDTPCPIGLHCPRGSSLPVPCQPGYFANFSQAASCVICPAGYYCVPEEVIEGNNATCTKSKEI